MTPESLPQALPLVGNVVAPSDLITTEFVRALKDVRRRGIDADWSTLRHSLTTLGNGNVQLVWSVCVRSHEQGPYMTVQVRP